MRRPFVAAVAFALAACGPDFEPPRVAVSQQALTTLTGWGTNPGGLNMYLYSPATPAASPGLVVAMHGCSQSAADYEKAGWETYAAQYGFYLLYPGITTGRKAF